jgi:hypothetical protein
MKLLLLSLLPIIVSCLVLKNEFNLKDNFIFNEISIRGSSCVYYNIGTTGQLSYQVKSDQNQGNSYFDVLFSPYEVVDNCLDIIFIREYSSINTTYANKYNMSYNIGNNSYLYIVNRNLIFTTNYAIMIDNNTTPYMQCNAVWYDDLDPYVKSIGISIACIFLVLIILVIIWFISYKCKKNDDVPKKSDILVEQIYTD